MTLRAATSLGPLLILAGLACGEAHSETAAPPAGGDVATFAGGCFWCMEPPFEKLDGVHDVVSGYAGGSEPSPSYEQVASGQLSSRSAYELSKVTDKMACRKMAVRAIDRQWTHQKAAKAVRSRSGKRRHGSPQVKQTFTTEAGWKIVASHRGKTTYHDLKEALDEVTQEIDALTVMGIDPVSFLVAPRLIALAVTLPCLVIFADVVGILGGLTVSVGALGIGLGA